MALLAAGVLAADQLSKALVLASQVGAAGGGAGDGAVMVRLVRNTGASGGLASAHPVLVTLAGLVIAACAVIFALRVRGRAAALCLAAACGGALGNLSDRLLRAPGLGHGAVVDWIHIAGGGGSFNVADMAIQFGAVGAVIAVFVSDRAARASQQEEPAGEG